MSDPDIILTITDFRKLYCASGVRRRCAEAGVDFRRLVEEGIPASELMGKGFDALIERVIEVKVRDDG